MSGTGADPVQRAHEQVSSQPTLSVVVPIYNVAPYLNECLESIADQTLQDFEVVLVDDGSTDSGPEIADRWAARDGRFRVVRQDNHGLGHARNTGLANASGRYLMFLDGDDKVTSHALGTMVETLEASGSDFATSNVHRFDSSGRTWQAPLYRWMKPDEQVGTHVTTNTLLLKDHLACNKVWRRSFLVDTGLRFPEGVLYEDLPAVVPAHVRATAVDLVPVVSVLWRVRDQGDSSITQNRRQEARHVRDRVDGILTASRYIAQHAGQALKDEYDAMVLGRDLRWYVDLYPELDSTYQRELFASVNRFLAEVSSTALARTPIAMRVAYALIARDAHEDFAAFVRLRRADQVGEVPVRIRSSRAVLDLTLPGGTDLPDSVLDVTDELRPVSRVSDIDVDDNYLVIQGWGYISRLPVEQPADHHIEVWLEGPDGHVPAEITYRRDARAAEGAGARVEASGRVAFTARVPLRSLSPRWQLRPRERFWLVMISVANGSITRIGPLGAPLTGRPERPLMRELRGQRWLRVSWTDEGLSCRVRREAAVLSAVHTDETGIDLTLRTDRPATAGSRLRLRPTGSSGGAEGILTYRVVAGPGGTATVRIPIADLPHLSAVGPVVEESPDESTVTWTTGGSWDLSYRAEKDGRWRRVLDPAWQLGHSVVAGDAEVSLRRTRAATVTLTRTPVTATLVGAEWLSDATLTLWLDSPAEFMVDKVALAATSETERVTFPVTADGERLRADVPVAALPRFGETVPLRAGTWDVKVGTATDVRPVRLGLDLAAAMPVTHSQHGREYTLTDRRRNTVSLLVASDLTANERGPANQRRLRNEVYREATGLHDAVLYEAYFGKEFSDSPRVIFDELVRRGVGGDHLVVVRDRQFTVPPGATAIPYRSQRYHEALAQSRYVVANTHLPRFFRRAPGQVVVQTWHGVGTKKIGLDMDSVHFANKSYIDNIRAGESENWDYLISPNPFTSPILTRAFAYRGTLLETGVPRNDIFHRPDRAERAAAVKARLGIAEGQTVVLYAPTWRDHLFDKAGRYRLDLRFDLHGAARRLGDEYAIVFRKHSNVADRLPPGPGRVIDASDYPDVQELLLVTDVLVSDYSTLMCDFANTGRPMLFYTYDLANYRDVLRGFYFDFENDVPGPLIMDEADLVPAILDAEKVRLDYDAKYRAFAERFCPWDDGQAVSRVVDAVFGELT